MDHFWSNPGLLVLENENGQYVKCFFYVIVHHRIGDYEDSLYVPINSVLSVATVIGKYQVSQKQVPMYQVVPSES